MLSALRAGAGHGEFNLYSELASSYREIGLPDLMRFGDLSGLARQVGAFDAQIRQWLREQSVDLCEFATLEEFRRSLPGTRRPQDGCSRFWLIFATSATAATAVSISSTVL
jgi:hypothetical protein